MIGPCRRMRGTAPVTSTTVEAVPPGQRPPSRIMAIRPSSWAATSAAVTGEGPPERLALVVASGAPAARISARVRSWFGMRTATVSPPAVTASETTAALVTTRVRGPGQKASASFLPAGGKGVGDERQVGRIGQEDWDGLVEAAELGRIETADRFVVPTHRAHAVDGVRGERDQFACSQQARRPRQMPLQKMRGLEGQDRPLERMCFSMT